MHVQSKRTLRFDGWERRCGEVEVRGMEREEKRERGGGGEGGKGRDPAPRIQEE